MTTADTIALTLVAIIGWWLSGFDSRLTGESRLRDFISRVFRCGFTLVLLLVFFALPGAINTYAETMAIIATLTLLWCRCLAEMGARGFHRLIDPEDKRVFDPDKNAREMDTIALLVKTGRRRKAIRLARRLKNTGDSSVFAMETLLEHLGVRKNSLPKLKPLTEAYLLRSRGHFKKAKTVLKSLLAGNPADADAALMLMQIYAQDLRQPGKAAKILRHLKTQPGIEPAWIEQAERSLREWRHPKLKLTAVAPPKSLDEIDELIGNGHFGMAVEILDAKTNAQPGNFWIWIRLAEVHAVYCNNLQRADAIIRQIENNPGFGAAQIQTARTRLQEWRNLAQRQS